MGNSSLTSLFTTTIFLTLNREIVVMKRKRGIPPIKYIVFLQIEHKMAANIRFVAGSYKTLVLFPIA